MKINWASISDDDIKELSLASYCGEPLDAMGRLCEDSAEAKKTIGAAIKSFSCTMGPAMQLDLAGHDAELDHQPQRPQHGRVRAQVPGEEAVRLVGAALLLVVARGARGRPRR